MPTPTRLIVGLGLALGAGPVAAQSSVALTKPDAEFKEPLTRFRAVREMTNGKVLAVDTQDKIVELIDFAKNAATKVGREGQGPGEYAMPGDLYPIPNGQVWLHDFLARRFLPIDQDGKIGPTVAAPGGGGPGVIGLGDFGGHFDGQGRLYFRGPPIDFGHGEPRPVDSMAILRWDRVGPKVDTVAWVRAPKNSATASGRGDRFTMRIGGAKVYTPEESWGVAGDGSIVRVIPSPFQVIWFPPAGKPVTGPVQPYTPIKVTDADRKAVIEAQKKQKPMMIAIGGGAARQAAPPNVQLPDPEFEDTKPPFFGPEAVRVTPEGEVWIRRSRPANDPVPLYEVFDRTGRVVRTVTLNPKSRVVAFGKGTVYVVRTDDEDLEYLQRFKR